MKKNKNRVQEISHTGIITHVTSPDGQTMVKIVAPYRFVIMEGTNIEKDYCCILDDELHISKKADYNTVVIHYTPSI